jgi:hypothetical protein
MAGAKLEKTRHTGIFKRDGLRGARYVVIYRDRDGTQRRETVKTLDEARERKRRREQGETNAAGRLTFAEYAREWVERHPVRDSTRTDYRRDLEAWVIPFLGEKRKLADVTPRAVHQLVAHLCAAEGQCGPLTDGAVRSILNP